ncbi:MAG TPA: two-component regulator propeller domain-containing protein, partial [Pyrinomonadaceae bacterium]|nr:two-component regulator propeller domain-containing protein [Pyrinomonadaceae bacterium]
MAENQNKKILRRSALRACLLLAIQLTGASAQQLPVRTYTVADGLAHDEVAKIVQDSRGFIWFCTTEGLSRFDGYRFTNYDARDGLSSVRVNDILESRRGSIYWLATDSGGVSRFDPLARSQSIAGQQNAAAPTESGNAPPLFTNYAVGNEEQTNFVNVVYEDRAGRIWAGTSGGLFRLEVDDPAGSFQRVELGLKARPDRVLEIYSIIEDREGSLWIGTAMGLVRRLLDGRTIHYTLQPAQATDTVWALLEDDEGRLWLGHQSGVLLLRPMPAASARVGDHFLWPDTQRKRPAQGSLQHAQAGVLLNVGEARQFTTPDGLPSDKVRALRRASDGRLCMGRRGGGISVYDGGRFRTYATAQGLTGRINALAEDRDGNIWVGTQTSGAIKISRSGLLSYREADGLGNTEIFSIFENKA